MDVKFYTFSKRRNSTLQPTGSGTVKACKLKENCSIHNPVVILNTNTMSYNYAYISTWSRYYFVTDVVYLANSLVEYHLEEDVLASNKTAIGNTKAMIAYASDHYNAFIVDPRMQVTTATTVQNGTINTVDGAPASPFSSEHFLVTVFNDRGYCASGMCSTYYMTEAELVNLVNWLCDASIMQTLGQFFNGNPLNAISSVKWIPYTIPSVRLSTQNVIIGDQDSNISTHEVTVFNYSSYKYKFQWNYHTDFRRVAPYTRGLLYLPGVGNVELNLADFTGSDFAYVKLSIEDLTGCVTYYVMNQTNSIISTYTCDVSAIIPIGMITANVSGVGNSLIGVVGGAGAALAGAVTGNGIIALGGVSTALASASNLALAANQKTTTVSGGSGSRFVSAEPAIKFVAFLAGTINPDDADYIAVMGRPVGYVTTIGTFSGYVQTVDAHVSTAGDVGEKEQIENFLNSGIYYE